MYPHMNVPYLPLPLSDYVSMRPLLPFRPSPGCMQTGNTLEQEIKLKGHEKTADLLQNWKPSTKVRAKQPRYTQLNLT
jgi:hypothetical protein